MVENLEAFGIGQYWLYAVAGFELKSVLVFDEKQQQSVVLVFVAYVPTVEQFVAKHLRVVVTDAA